MMRDGPQQANYTGVTVQILIQQAYQVRDFQVVGAPSWLSSRHYDIVAKQPAGITTMPSDPMAATDQQRETFRNMRQAMVRDMLTDRFKLKSHRETRNLPVFALVVANGGAKLKPSNGTNLSDPDLKSGMLRFNQGSLSGTELGISDLIEPLSTLTSRIVLDRTSLDGKYDFSLKWTPDMNLSSATPLPPSAAITDTPDLFSALQSQMGLKLQSSTSPVDVLVIDSVEAPSDN